MTRVLAKYKSKVISRHPIQKFMVKIDNCKVELESRQQELIIQISGKAGEEKTKKLRPSAPPENRPAEGFFAKV